MISPATAHHFLDSGVARFSSTKMDAKEEHATGKMATMFVTRWRTSFTCTGGELPEIRSLSDVIRVLAGTVALFAAAPVWGQVAAPPIDLVAAQPVFEVASLKRIGPAPPVQGNSGSVRVTEGMRRSGDTVRCVLPLASLLTVAFHLSQWQIQGPEWLGVERYQLDAKMPAGSSSRTSPLCFRPC